MLKNPYYLVVQMVSFENSSYPYFLNCTVQSGKFYIINDLSQYLNDGSSISDEEVEDYSSYILINDSNWETRINNLKF
ncbi:hypothetical protein SAMN04488552_0219 [Christiangramia echinicola]|uniref:Uncharacterized protein n=1 Tax=Christiangramia echinicola TaxID=279359 RepID=A0A1H1KUE4_9FLAO|nr:hypothetical protein SAMN04488552_0219 [Christiangramia echinicola]